MKILLTVVILSLALGFAVNKYFFHKTEKTKTTAAVDVTKNASYWTCPMHPFIKKDGPGECPICHMKLVQVKADNTSSKRSDIADERATFKATPMQLELAGQQKHTVEKMNLTVKFPISGRFISSSSVAFQIYESDLRYIKRGSVFKGESSVYSNSEISGVIVAIDSIIDPSSRTIRAVGSVKKAPSDLIPETSFSGTIEINLDDRIAIPENSVMHTGTNNIVYLVDENNKLSPKTIRLGLKSDSYYEVLDGLKIGDVISSGPNFLLDSEAKIRGAND